MTDGPCENTDRELWREREDDYYADSVHVTKGGGIGINVGGHVIVKPISEWHRLVEARHTFWVVERFEDDRSAGYWDGGNSRSFVADIDNAIQFCRRQDAMWVIVGWHWRDVQTTEHIMLNSGRAS